MLPAPIPTDPPAYSAPAQQQGIAPASYQQPYQQAPQQPYQQPYQQAPQQPMQPQPYQQPYQQTPQYPYQQMPVQQVNVVMTNNNVAPAVLLVNKKSVFVALLLTFFFGPFGMFYSTVKGAVIMLIVTIVIGGLTAGLAGLVIWPVCMIWGALAADAHNKSIIARV
jgi:hypothetical protein